MTVETDPYDFSNKYDIKSWMDLNDGLLKIDCTSGQLIKVKLGTGPYYTYPMTFSINKSDTIGENSFLKSINVHWFNEVTVGMIGTSIIYLQRVLIPALKNPNLSNPKPQH